MKITIDLENCEQYGLAPSFVYRTLCHEHVELLEAKYKVSLWAMHHYLDNVARQLYSKTKPNRKTNVKNLILTYQDAEECFELFKKISEVWASEYINLVRNRPIIF